MQWFTGSIPEAIGESKRKGLVFIVYIEGVLCQSVHVTSLHFIQVFSLICLHDSIYLRSNCDYI